MDTILSAFSSYTLMLCDDTISSVWVVTISSVCNGLFPWATWRALMLDVIICTVTVLRKIVVMV